MDANIVQSAVRFARALDSEDYETVHSMLAADCRYDARKETLVGPDAITESYRENGRLARTLFDRVDYSSNITKTAPDHAEIVFADHLRSRGRDHVYKCLQVIHFRPDGLIDAIQHRELPGERERLLRFSADCGISLPEVHPRRTGGDKDSLANGP